MIIVHSRVETKGVGVTFVIYWLCSGALLAHSGEDPRVPRPRVHNKIQRLHMGPNVESRRDQNIILRSQSTLHKATFPLL